ncbi:hypothetical protein M011DRAFT_331916 [Sporormia fimetaria CBS 119925]|uniref:NAD-dependent epimerase/dehydratase domain-containing protein n=1 Tax=Sporormia fimetaria CBS 119925 TaxID=1340428 RepID=A0A6A6VDF0_9PLEO|nr:hypothetical protein M011DRAFT_331916 [Sporormia fimetaria CBS 119925]
MSSPSHHLLLTGGSGYLGGTLLSHIPGAHLPKSLKISALVRTPEQAKAVATYGATPLYIDTSSPDLIHAAIVDNKITIIYYLHDAQGSHVVPFIRGLAQVQESTGQQTHFLFTSGARMFSSHAGAPFDKPLLDTDPNLFEIQKSQQAHHESIKRGVRANNTVIETAESLGVKSYIFVPSLVFGRGEGFGNRISVQTVAIVQAARRARKVYKVDDGTPKWPVCHVRDVAELYLCILKAVVEGREVGSGKMGYYLAASGHVSWMELYEAVGKALFKRGVVDSEEVGQAGKKEQTTMASGIGCRVEMVEVQLGGACAFTAEHGNRIGWIARFPPSDVLHIADEEVGFILKKLKEKEEAHVGHGYS